MNKYESVIGNFKWISDIPVGATIVDPSDNSVVLANELFLGVFGLGLDADIPRLDIPYSYDGKRTISDVTLNGIKKHIVTSTKKVTTPDGDFLVNIHEDSIVMYDTHGQGVYNYTSCVSLLSDYIETAEARGEKFSAGVFMLVHFVDDSNTEVIEKYTDDFIITVQQATRNTDIFARLDKDEFLLLFPKCAYDVAENIMTTIEAKFAVNAGHDDPGSASSAAFGLLEYKPGSKMKAEEFISELRKLAI